MNFDAMLRFCKHFGLFPDLIAKSLLKRIFLVLSEIHEASEAPISKEQFVCGNFKEGGGAGNTSGRAHS